MTADPHIDRAVRIAKAIREESSDPVTFPLWKPWAIDMADGIGALAARLEAAERENTRLVRDLADARKAMEFLANETLFGSIVAEYAQKKLAAAQEPPAECHDCGLDLEPGEKHGQVEGIGCVAQEPPAKGDDLGCPVCNAPPDEMCTTPSGKPRNDHARREYAQPPAKGDAR